MTEPMRLLVAGDLHGDTQHVRYLYDRARAEGADRIVQTGDFGYWEHHGSGVEFLDFCAKQAERAGIELDWVDGNHEAHTTLRDLYGPGRPRHALTPEGFWVVRPGVHYIPRGHRWSWGGFTLMGLGGAYSVDKRQRVDDMRMRRLQAEQENAFRTAAGHPAKDVDEMVAKYQSWWPEEELTDADVATALADPTPIDILFTHDKPRASNPRWNRKDFPECVPNQQRIQTVVNALHPRLLLHGHLHFRYTDEILCGDGRYTRVEGLDCNYRDQQSGGPIIDSWITVDLKRESAE